MEEALKVEMETVVVSLKRNVTESWERAKNRSFDNGVVQFLFCLS